MLHSKGFSVCRFEQGMLAQLERAYRHLNAGEFWSWSAFRESLSKDDVELLCAMQGSEVVGFLLSQQIGDEVELYFIYVAEDYRSKGLGMSLMKNWLEALIQAQVRSVYLEVRASNFAAQRLYERCGFLKISERKAYYRDGEDAYVFQRTLR